jgi:hypothetical protein
MNLRPPPKTDDVKELTAWCEELYEFLKHPVFHAIRLYPRAAGASDVKGEMFYDSDDDKFKGYIGSWAEFGDIT